MSPGKTENHVEYLRHHSTDFHQVFTNQNDRNVSGHLILVTDDLENVGQGQIYKYALF